MSWSTFEALLRGHNSLCKDELEAAESVADGDNPMATGDAAVLAKCKAILRRTTCDSTDTEVASLIAEQGMRITKFVWWPCGLGAISMGAHGRHRSLWIKLCVRRWGLGCCCPFVVDVGVQLLLWTWRSLLRCAGFIIPEG